MLLSRRVRWAVENFSFEFAVIGLILGWAFASRLVRSTPSAHAARRGLT